MNSGLRDKMRYSLISAASEQSQKTKREEKTPKGKPPEEKSASKIIDKGKKLKEDMDKLLDDIDKVLEENAEEFVKSYIQRGGE